jgi:tetratricopeptide (TPR) repeat protein
MGGHTLFRIGRYEEVAVLNAAAMKIDSEFGAREGLKGPISKPIYYLHNTGFGLAGALMSGDRALALRYADHVPVAFPAGSPGDRRTTALGRSYIAYGRFDPQRALALPEDPAAGVYARIMRHYARGEAFAARGDATSVLAEAGALAAMKPPATDIGGANSIKLAAAVLQGRAAMLQGRPEAAIEAFEPAAKLQEKIYATAWDPPPWWYPIRRSLAAAELKAGRAAEAARDARATLTRWPGDGLSLQVLADAEARLGQTGEAADHRSRAKLAWRGGPAMPGLELI